jgi:hypothetical protein
MNEKKNEKQTRMGEQKEKENRDSKRASQTNAYSEQNHSFLTLKQKKFSKRYVKFPHLI